jgi:hypothetical protein
LAVSDDNSITIDKISKSPVEYLRRKLAADLISPNPLAPNYLETYVDIIQKLADSKDAELLVQIEAAEQAVKNQKLEIEPELENPLAQLAWAAAFGTLIKNGADVAGSELLEDFVCSDAIRYEDRISSFKAMGEVEAESGRLEWTLPDARTFVPTSGYDREGGVFKKDLFWSLLMGFEHARAADQREIGFSRLSVDLPENAKSAIADFMKTKPEEMTAELLGRVTEAQKTIELWAENENTVNFEFAKRQSPIVGQDFAYSLKHMEYATGSGPVRVDDAPQSLLANIGRVLHGAFFMREGYFGDTPAEWKKVGVDASKIPDFDRLVEKCASVADIQPEWYKWFSEPDDLVRDTLDKQAARNAVLAEVIGGWAQKYIDAIRDKMMEQCKDMSSQAMHQLGESMVGKAQKIAKRDKAGENAEKAEQNAMGGGMFENDLVETRNEEEAKRQENDPEGDHEAEGGDQTRDGEGAKDGNGDPGENGRPDNSDADRRAKSQRPRPKRDPVFQKHKKKSKYKEERKELMHSYEGGKVNQQRGNAAQYQEVVGRFSGEINIIRRTLGQLQRRQLKHQITMIRDWELVPSDSPFVRLDMDRYVHMMNKSASGQDLSEDDYRLFKIDDKEARIPAPIDLIISLDDSGSMSGRIKALTDAACIIFESAKKYKFNIYIELMTDDVCTTLARPGDTPEIVGEKLVAIGNSGVGSDHLLPVLYSHFARMGKQRSGGDLVGSTHFFVLSDGGFTDSRYSIPFFKAAVDPGSPFFTYDFFLFGGASGFQAAIDGSVKEKSAKSGAIADTVSVQRLENEDNLSRMMVEMFLKRLKNSRVASIPMSRKRAEASKVLRRASALTPDFKKWLERRNYRSGRGSAGFLDLDFDDFDSYDMLGKKIVSELGVNTR